MNDTYEPHPIDDLAEDVLQGYSTALNLNLRWEQGQLGLYIPATGRHMATFVGERARADREWVARTRAEAQVLIERARADREQAARAQAEARARELEEMLRQLHNP